MFHSNFKISLLSHPRRYEYISHDNELHRSSNTSVIGLMNGLEEEVK